VTKRITLTLALSISLVSSGCASSIQQRSATIAASDRQAKAVIEMEQQLDPSRIPPRSLSVMPFEAVSTDSVLVRLGYALAAFLSADLGVVAPQLQLVERQRVDAIVREAGLAQQGAIDARTAPRVGRLVGAFRSVIGSITRTNGNSLILNSRIVEVVNGQVRDAVSANTSLDQIIDAEKALALRLFAALNITLTPAQRARVERRQTTNLSAILAFGRGLEAEARGDAAAATRAFQEAARIDPGFEAARAQASGRSSTSRPAGVTRILALTEQVINAVETTRTAEVTNIAGEQALANSSLFTLLITIRVF
jgi:hypothetical protein